MCGACGYRQEPAWAESRARGRYRRPLAREHEAVAYAFNEWAVLVAVADPVDGFGLDTIRTTLGRPVHFVVATKTQIEAAHEEAYGT